MRAHDSPLQVVEVVVCNPEGHHVSSNEKTVLLPPTVTGGYKDITVTIVEQ
jgi:hypothetical protein